MHNDKHGSYAKVFLQIKVEFEEFKLQPPVLGDCRFDKMFLVAGSSLPVLCGHNDGQHMYINVEGRSTTDLSIFLKELESQLYSCPDRFHLKDIVRKEDQILCIFHHHSSL